MPRNTASAGRRVVPPRSQSPIERRAARAELRKTGIRAMGDVAWGSHICLFYDTERDLLDTNAAYLDAGLSENEFCVWAVSEPLTIPSAQSFLRQNIAKFDHYVTRGQINFLRNDEWFLAGKELNPQRITGGWHEKLHAALSRGFAGMRVSGNAFWMQRNRWKEFREYEEELDRSLADSKMIMMCTYSLQAARAVDLLDVTRVHNFTVARRGGDWEYLESPELREARAEISKLRNGMDILSKPFPGHEQLTDQERVVLAQVVRGATSREAAQTLGLSHRTIESHRHNFMQKLGAKNVVDLLRIVLGQD